MIVFVLLLIFMTLPTPHHGISVDLPRVSYPVSMPGANREDAIKITIMRDGKVFIRNEQIVPTEFVVAQTLTKCLEDREVEHKAYIVAEARAYWGTVRLVLQGVHDAGIIRVAFLADQRRPAVLTSLR